MLTTNDRIVAFLGDQRLPERFWDKVMPEPNTGCWLWIAGRSKSGYGTFKFGKRTQRAHRVSYIALIGEVPDGLELDHVRARGCLGKECVNPGHLEPVTHRENMLRGKGFASDHANRTHCKRGHAFDSSNTKLYKAKSGSTLRLCRACIKLKNKGPQTHCKRGHPLNEENTRAYTDPAGNHRRICRACLELKRAKPK